MRNVAYTLMSIAMGGILSVTLFFMTQVPVFMTGALIVSLSCLLVAYVILIAEKDLEK